MDELLLPLSFSANPIRQVEEVISGGMLSGFSFVMFVTNLRPSVFELIA